MAAGRSGPDLGRRDHEGVDDAKARHFDAEALQPQRDRVTQMPAKRDAENRDPRAPSRDFVRQIADQNLRAETLVRVAPPAGIDHGRETGGLGRGRGESAQVRNTAAGAGENGDPKRSGVGG